MFSRRKQFVLLEKGVYSEMAKKYGDNEGTKQMVHQVIKQLRKYLNHLNTGEEVIPLCIVPEQSAVIRDAHIMSKYFKKYMKKYKKEKGVESEEKGYFLLYMTIAEDIINLIYRSIKKNIPEAQEKRKKGEKK